MRRFEPSHRIASQSHFGAPLVSLVCLRALVLRLVSVGVSRLSPLPRGHFTGAHFTLALCLHSRAPRRAARCTLDSSESASACLLLHIHPVHSDSYRTRAFDAASLIIITHHTPNLHRNLLSRCHSARISPHVTQAAALSARLFALASRAYRPSIDTVSLELRVVPIDSSHLISNLIRILACALHPASPVSLPPVSVCLLHSFVRCPS